MKDGENSLCEKTLTSWRFFASPKGKEAAPVKEFSLKDNANHRFRAFPIIRNRWEPSSSETGYSDLRFAAFIAASNRGCSATICDANSPGVLSVGSMPSV